MKRLALLIVCAISLSMVSYAQKTRVSTEFGNATVISNSTTLNSGAVPIAYSGNNTALQGLWPDSMYIRWYASGDTNSIQLKYQVAYLGVFNTATVIETLTTAKDQSYYLVPHTKYGMASNIKITATALSSGNAAVLANKTRLSMSLDRYYSIR